MLQMMMMIAAVLLLCVISSKLLYRFGIPTLLIFLVLGMLFGSDGIVGIRFDNYEFARQICSIGLVFIMFYGGFGTNWKAARPVLKPAAWMSTVGVLATAVLTGLFSTYLLGCGLWEGLLIGCVVASTDAASVFAILRSRKLNLKGGLASLLEVESGSNDPFSYMLTVIALTFLTGGNAGSIWWMLLLQIGLGLLFGLLLGKGAAFVLRQINLEIDGLYPIFTAAAVILGYSLCEILGGNGYLCVYLIGLIVGNSKILHKRSLIHFFDGLSWVMQIMLFFTLGLLSFPSQLPKVIGPGILLSLFMIFVARPAATFSILSWFKVPIKQQLFVSWVGLRGAASIVFAITAAASHANLGTDIFHMVFFVALFSVSVQGTLIPTIAKKLGLVETDVSVFTTFNDYEEEGLARLYELPIHTHSPWCGKIVMEAGIPDDVLVVMIKRGSGMVVPKGSTKILAGDVLVLCGGRKNAGGSLPPPGGESSPPPASGTPETGELEQDSPPDTAVHQE